MENLLLEALNYDERIEVLSALLDQNIPIKITSAFLLSWLDEITDQVLIIFFIFLTVLVFL